MVFGIPAELEQVRLTGKYVDFDGYPIVGRVRFEAKVPVIIAPADDVVVVPIIREVTLSNGEFSTDLPATDDPDVIQPTWNYKVTEIWQGGRTYRMLLPGRQGPQTITDLSPIATFTDASVGARGATGPPGPSGPSGQSGYFGPPEVGTDIVTVPIISSWGITAGGQAYYNPQGAPRSEAAILGYNSRGQLVLRKNDGSSDPTVTGDVYDATSEQAMLDLSFAKKGDRVRRQDINRMFQLRVEPASAIGNWIADLNPIGAVTSVDGLTGEVGLNGRYLPITGQRAVLPASGLLAPLTGTPTPETVPAADTQFVYVDSGLGRLSWKDAAGQYGRVASHLGEGTTFPAVPRAGDTFVHTGLGSSLMRFNGVAWRQAEAVTVATRAARVAISTSYSGDLHIGFQVYETATKQIRRWNGSGWGFAGMLTGDNPYIYINRTTLAWGNTDGLVYGFGQQANIDTDVFSFVAGTSTAVATAGRIVVAEDGRYRVTALNQVQASNSYFGSTVLNFGGTAANSKVTKFNTGAGSGAPTGFQDLLVSDEVFMPAGGIIYDRLYLNEATSTIRAAHLLAERIPD